MGGAKKLLKKVVDIHKSVIDPGGHGEKTVKQVTGITAQKEAAAAASAATAEQATLLAKQEKDLAARETEREERMKRRRQGRRSLLYSGTDELGVKSTALGG